MRTNCNLLRHALCLGILIAASFATSGQAQEPKAQGATQEQTESYEPENYATTLRWVNTLIFAAALGYLVSKTAPAFFNARSSDIRKAIEDATGLKIAADFRSSEIDRKMATLPDAVAQLRKEAGEELGREHARINGETQERLAQMRTNTGHQVDAVQREGVLALRRRTTDLAFALAERRLAGQAAPEFEGLYLQDFVHMVEQGKN